MAPQVVEHREHPKELLSYVQKRREVLAQKRLVIPQVLEKKLTKLVEALAAGSVPLVGEAGAEAEVEE
jgi:hypothetical protein